MRENGTSQREVQFPLSGVSKFFLWNVRKYGEFSHVYEGISTYIMRDDDCEWNESIRIRRCVNEIMLRRGGFCYVVPEGRWNWKFGYYTRRSRRDDERIRGLTGFTRIQNLRVVRDSAYEYIEFVHDGFLFYFQLWDKCMHFSNLFDNVVDSGGKVYCILD